MSYVLSQDAPPPIGSKVCIASFAAGPIFVAAAGLIELADQTVSGMSNDLSWVMPLMVVNPIVIAFGFILAVLPNLLGAWIMRWLATDNIGVRLPVVWALVGGLSGAAIGMVCSAPAGIIGALAVTGLSCALICRRGMAWC